MAISFPKKAWCIVGTQKVFMGYVSVWGWCHSLASGVTVASVNPSWLFHGDQAKNWFQSCPDLRLFSPNWATCSSLGLTQVALRLVRTWAPSVGRSNSLDSDAHCSPPCPWIQAATQEAVWPAVGGAVPFTSKISSDLKTHSTAPAPLTPRKTVDVRSLLRYLEENSSSCSLPSLHEVIESGWQSKQWHALGLAPALISGFSSPSFLPILRMADLDVDNKLSWTCSLGSWVANVWEAFSVALSRTS